MTLQEFKDNILGGRHSTVMVCQVEGSQDMGHSYEVGGMTHVSTEKAFALYKQLANVGKEEVRRWLPSNANMTANETLQVNKHFEKEFQQESGEKPIQIKKHKK